MAWLKDPKTWGRIVAVLVGAAMVFGLIGPSSPIVSLLGGVLAGLGVPFPWKRRPEKRDDRPRRPRLPLLVLVPLAALWLTGCVCPPYEAYVAADKQRYNAIAPEYQEYVLDDDELTEDQKDRRLRTLDAWRRALEENEGE